MKLKRITLLLSCIALWSISIWGQQETSPKTDTTSNTVNDTLYREDQFYLGFTFNLMNNRPKGVQQSGFSGGVHLGFIRDIPLNKKRNRALGIGLGWSANSYGLNLQIAGNDKTGTTFTALDDETISYDNNRYTTYLIESPIQFRWRTSTPDSFKFWRIYTGLRLGYIYHFKSKFESGEQQIIRRNIEELNPFRFGATFTFGYSTFNFHLYYSLNSFFEGQTVESQQEIGITTFKIGLMFYIL